MNFLKWLVLAVVLNCPIAVASTSVVSTVPVGFVTVEVAAGTGITKRITLLSLPLLGVDVRYPSRGQVTSVQSGALGVSMQDGSLAPGVLSKKEEPFALQMTSGSAEGMMFLVSSNNSNTASVIYLTDPADSGLNLVNAGITSGDTFRLLVCDTLLSLFGTPAESGVVGSTNVNSADTVTLINNGSAQTYFYHTGLGRWTRVGLGSSDASHVPLMPYYGLQYSRVGSTPLRLLAVGEVPQGKRKVKIKGSGSTLLAGYWPETTTLEQSGLSNMPGWRMTATPQSSDRVTLTTRGSAWTYAHNGQNWRRVSLGFPASDGVQLPPGSALLISRTGMSSQNDVLNQVAPYSGN